MDWSASLDTTGLVSSAEKATEALGGMRDALKSTKEELGADDKAAGAALKGARGAAKKAKEGTEKAAPAPKPEKPVDNSKVIAARVKANSDFAYLMTRQEAQAKGWTQKQEALELAKRRTTAALASGASFLDVTKLAEKENAARGALKTDNLAKNASVNAGTLKALAAAGLVAGVGLGIVASGMKAVIGLASAATGVASFGDLAKLAIGARAMSQIQGIQARTNLGFRMMFRGIDPSPLVRAVDLFSRNFTAQTTTGRVLGETLSRAFGGAFAAIERLEPVATVAFQGILLGSLMVENAWLRLRIAAFPITSAIQKAIGPVDALAVSSAVVQAVFAKIAADINSTIVAVQKLSSLAASFGLIEPAKGDPNRTEKVKRKAAPGAVADGQAVGSAMGGGMVAGLDGQQGALYDAGKRAAEAALKGAKASAEIRSPAHRFRREVGRQMGAGTVGGLDDSAEDIRRSAARSLVPDPSKLQLGGRGAGGGGLTVNGPLVSAQIVVGGESGLAATVRRILDAEVARAVEKLGLSMPART